MSAVEVRGVSHHYGRSDPRSTVSASTPRPANCSPWPDRRCGKSSLVHLVAGLDAVPGGQRHGPRPLPHVDPRLDAAVGGAAAARPPARTQRVGERPALRRLASAYDTGPRRGGACDGGAGHRSDGGPPGRGALPRRAAAGRGRSRTGGRPPGAGPRRAVAHQDEGRLEVVVGRCGLLRRRGPQSWSPPTTRRSSRRRTAPYASPTVAWSGEDCAVAMVLARDVCAAGRSARPRTLTAAPFGQTINLHNSTLGGINMGVFSRRLIAGAIAIGLSGAVGGAAPRCVGGQRQQHGRQRQLRRRVQRGRPWLRAGLPDGQRGGLLLHGQRRGVRARGARPPGRAARRWPTTTSRRI